jgi:thioredoxin reductase (NADPH)
MEQTIESILIYSMAIILCVVVVIFYLRKKNKASRLVEEKVKRAKEQGLHEPVSLHPVVDANR